MFFFLTLQFLINFVLTILGFKMRSMGRVEVGGRLVYVKNVTFQINTLTFPGIDMCQS